MKGLRLTLFRVALFDRFRDRLSDRVLPFALRILPGQTIKFAGRTDDALTYWLTFESSRFFSAYSSCAVSSWRLSIGLCYGICYGRFQVWGCTVDLHLHTFLVVNSHGIS